jgi:hypothetical protein
LDVRFSKPGIAFLNFRDAGAGSEKIENERNPNPVPADARFPEAALRIDPDSSEEFFPVHVVTLATSTGCVNREMATGSG